MTILVNGLANIGQTPIPAGAILAMAAIDIETLRERAQTAIGERESIVAAADEAGRDLSDDEIEKLAGLKTEVERLGKQIAAREAIAIPGPGRRTAAEIHPQAQGQSHGANPATPRTGTAVAARAVDRRGGFRSTGDFAQCG